MSARYVWEQDRIPARFFHVKDDKGRLQECSSYSWNKNKRCQSSTNSCNSWSMADWEKYKKESAEICAGRDLTAFVWFCVLAFWRNFKPKENFPLENPRDVHLHDFRKSGWLFPASWILISSKFFVKEKSNSFWNPTPVGRRATKTKRGYLFCFFSSQLIEFSKDELFELKMNVDQLPWTKQKSKPRAFSLEVTGGLRAWNCQGA